MEKIINLINDALYSYALIIILVLGGMYFTLRSQAVQFRSLPDTFKASDIDLPHEVDYWK